MKITPLDIKKQEFKKVMRGYDPVEVDTFMDMMASELEDLLRHQKDFRDKIVELETQLKDYRQIEKTLQQTLLQAQEATSKTYEAARREADVILKDAELRATKLVDRANADLGRIMQDASQLKARRDTLMGRLRILLTSELDLLKSLEGGTDDTDAGPSLGTGKESLQIDEILKTIDDDGTPRTH